MVAYRLRKYGAILGVTSLLLLSGCVEKEPETEETPTEQVSVDYTYDKGDLEKHVNEFHKIRGDTLLNLIANEEWERDETRYADRVKEMKTYFSTQKDSTMTDEQIEREAITSLFVEDVALSYFGADYEKVKEEQQQGRGAHVVIHGVITNTVGITNLQQYAKSLKLDMESIENVDDTNEIAEKYRHHVDFGLHYFGSHNVIDGFESVRNLREGQAQIYGNDEYASVMYVLEEVALEEINDYLAIYTHSFSQIYPRSIEILEYWSNSSGKTYEYLGDKGDLAESV